MEKNYRTKQEQTAAMTRLIGACKDYDESFSKNAPYIILESIFESEGLNITSKEGNFNSRLFAYISNKLELNVVDYSSVFANMPEILVSGIYNAYDGVAEMIENKQLILDDRKDLVSELKRQGNRFRKKFQEKTGLLPLQYYVAHPNEDGLVMESTTSSKDLKDTFGKEPTTEEMLNSPLVKKIIENHNISNPGQPIGMPDIYFELLESDPEFRYHK